MLEILIMIGVVKAFSKKAKEKNLSKVLWSIIGAASYYVPVLVMGLLILPNLVMNGTISVSSESSYMIMSIGANLLTGVLCCLGAYVVLLNMKSNIPPVNDQILDDLESTPE